MKRFRIGFFLVLFLLVTVPAGYILAQADADRVISAGEVINESITVYDGDLTIEAGAVVNSPVTIYDGDLLLAGTVNGAVTLFDGTLTIMEDGQLHGECVLLGDSVQESGDHAVTCSAVPSIPAIAQLLDGLAAPAPPAGVATPAVVTPPDVVIPPVPVHGETSWLGRGIGNFVGNVVETAGWTFTLGVLALVIASVFPRQLNQVSQVISEKPVTSGTVGLLTGVAGASLLALMSAVFGVLVLACGLGLLGFPIMLIVSAALIAAAIMGWVALGYKVGLWLAGPLKLKNPSLQTASVLGTVALSLAVGMFNVMGLGFGQWVLTIIVGAVGMGAAALTQLGTRSYPAPVADPVKINTVLQTLPSDEG
ncbi:MAG: hypothetical protein KA314_00020 [Chloroflexi bacterium]|nr:hypothetical protein [Chloroflexota bacterium]MBP8054192.1 hypothetical protein [Chloroflexota bacterium]